MPATVWVAGAWCGAVAAGVVLLPDLPRVGLVAIAMAISAIGAAFVVRPVALPLAVAAAALGLARAELPAQDQAPRLQAPNHVGERVVVRGDIIDDPRLRSDGVEILVRPETTVSSSGPQAQLGNVLFRVRGQGDFWIGDRVEATGRLALPTQPPGFDRRAYLAQKGTYLEMRTSNVNVLSHGRGPDELPGWMRERYRAAISTLIPEPHASVLVGVVLGIRSGIPGHLQHDLVATGLVHLLVLSGLKVAVFARLALAAFRPVLGRAAGIPVLALLALYALAGGATPAALRATAMGGLTLLALHLGRRTHVWTSLSLCAAVMLALRPDYAWDVGFQLSFAGTASIILLTRPIEGWIQRVPALLREPFAVTCAAQLGTLPLMAADFHLLSPSAPVANALVLPLLPAMIALGLLLAPLALVPDLGRIVALPLAGLLIYLEQVASLGARLPIASIPIPEFPPWAGLAYYLSTIGALVTHRLGGRRRLATIAVGIMGPALVGGIELGATSQAAPTVRVLSVGDGQAVLLSGPGGRVLIDGGPTPARLDGELGLQLPPWQRDLDALVITAPSPGHTGGLVGFGRRVGTVVVPALAVTGSTWRTAVAEAQTHGAGVVRVIAGQRFRIAGFDFEVLAPEPADPTDEPGSGYLAMRVSRAGGPAFCDLSDLGPDAQIVASGRLLGTCDYLLLPSAGHSSPTPELLARAHPRLLIASTAAGRLTRDLLTANLRRTDQEGTLDLPM